MTITVFVSVTVAIDPTASFARLERAGIHSTAI